MRADAWAALMAIMQADAWAALAAWVTAAIAFGTVVVAARFGRQQVAAAFKQIDDAQDARRKQDVQAQDALATQAHVAQETLEHEAREAQKTRDEIAQPNVAIFMESNQAVWQMVELVVKNFGATPARDVKIAIAPQPRVSPSHSQQDCTDLPYPEVIPVLAPGQEWRTVWDFGPTRTKTEGLESRHDATVDYQDSKGKPHRTTGVLDFGMFIDVTRVDVKTIHDLVKKLDSRMEKQHDSLELIARMLGRFTTEHEGVWVYGGRDDDERDYRAEREHRRAEERAASMRQVDQMLRKVVPHQYKDDETTSSSDQTSESHSPEPE